MKLHLARLNSKAWKEALPMDEQEFWRSKLVDLVNLPSIKVPRCVITRGCNNQEMQLVCFADAPHDAGKVAIYAGEQVAPRVYSSTLLTAKSRLMKVSVPRNELSAIMLMCELAFIAKRALGDRVK